jgi:hypothetical protein
MTDPKSTHTRMTRMALQARPQSHADSQSIIES